MKEQVAHVPDGYRTSVTHAGVMCWSDCVRVDSNSGLVYASLFGSQNSVRAIWADIVLRKPEFAKTAEGVEFGPATDRWVRYVSASAPVDKGVTHLVVARVEATTQVDLYSSVFYTVHNDPAQAWWPVFKRLMPVPVKDSWREALWRLGTGKGGDDWGTRPITKLKGIGTPGYEVVVKRNTWLEIIKHGFAKGELQ